MSQKNKKKKPNKSDVSALKHVDVLQNIIETEEKPNHSRIETYRKIAGSNKVVNIPIEDISLTENIRREIDTECKEFKSLLSSIKSNGILQNVIVEFRDTGRDYTVVCVAGHRRITAAKIANISMVPAAVRATLNPENKHEIMLSENLLRKDLHCLETATGYNNLFNLGWSREKISTKYGKADRTISMYLKMADWSQKAKDLIFANPDIFTTRNLMQKIACRAFKTEEDLLFALSKLLEQTKPTEKKISKKERLHTELTTHLVKNKYSDRIKKIVVDTFKELGVIA